MHHGSTGFDIRFDNLGFAPDAFDEHRALELIHLEGFGRGARSVRLSTAG
jgi:hypothetical protein